MRDARRVARRNPRRAARRSRCCAGRGTPSASTFCANRLGTDAWSGTVTGTISAAAITLSVQATGTIDGARCDTGALSLALGQV